jgi:uncharacterized membrane protein (UPF0127 family)
MRGRRTGRVATTDGIEIAAECELAYGMIPRVRGLLGRNGLDPGRGMLIARTSSVHMFFMRFAIDVVFVDRSNRIVRIVPDLKPWRIAAAWRARTALELPAGTAARLGLTPGMTVLVEEAG